MLVNIQLLVSDSPSVCGWHEKPKKIFTSAPHEYVHESRSQIQSDPIGVTLTLHFPLLVSMSLSVCLHAGPPPQHISSRRHKDRAAGKPAKPKFSPYSSSQRHHSLQSVSALLFLPPPVTSWHFGIARVIAVCDSLSSVCFPRLRST